MLEILNVEICLICYDVGNDTTCGGQTQLSDSIIISSSHIFLYDRHSFDDQFRQNVIVQSDSTFQLSM